MRVELDPVPGDHRDTVVYTFNGNADHFAVFLCGHCCRSSGSFRMTDASHLSFLRSVLRGVPEVYRN